jgi:hypothetical protein
MFFRRQYRSHPSRPPKKIGGNFCTLKVCDPSWPNSFSILLCITRIAVITTMIENTPTSTPTSVSAERSLCAARALIAIRKLSLTSAGRMSHSLRDGKR